MSNTVLLGLLSGMLPFKSSSWIDVIRENVAGYKVDININEFNNRRSKYENIH